jgi:hypothetical protein
MSKLSVFCEDYLLTTRSWALIERQPEIPKKLCNTKVHDRVHKSPPVIPILNRINKINTISSNIITQPYKLAALYSPEILLLFCFWYSFLLVDE